MSADAYGLEGLLPHVTVRSGLKFNPHSTKVLFFFIGGFYILGINYIINYRPYASQDKSVESDKHCVLNHQPQHMVSDRNTVTHVTQTSRLGDKMTLAFVK